MSIILPPKRFESETNPKYDGIRFQPWFHRLSERRQKLDDLEGARLRWRSYQTIRKDAQKYAAEMSNVDERELRDYIAYWNYESKGADKTDQHILDEAYEIYCKNKGEVTIKACLDRVAPFYGRTARSVFELYETDRNFYPTRYTFARG